MFMIIFFKVIRNADYCWSLKGMGFDTKAQAASCKMLISLCHKRMSFLKPYTKMSVAFYQTLFYWTSQIPHFFLKLIWQFRSSYLLPEKEKEHYRPLNRSTGAPRNLVRPAGMMFWGNKFFVGISSQQQLMRIATCRNKCEVKTHFKKKEFLNPVIGKKHNMTK